jgi:hypothetical protein
MSSQANLGAFSHGTVPTRHLNHTFCIIAEEPPDPPDPPRSRTDRIPYGQGIDASRTARYRAYPVYASRVINFLQQGGERVTKEVLAQLIASVVSVLPPCLRPPPPSRSQKRSKGGLVCWIDEHQELVMSYLVCRCIHR